MLKESTYFVCYQLNTRTASGQPPTLRDAVVNIKEPQDPAFMLRALKEAVNPPAKADLSDGFPGRTLSDVTIVNFIKLAPRQ